MLQIIELIRNKYPDWNIDWDKSCGEEWVRFGNSTHGLVCLIHTQIKLIFCNKNYDLNLKNIAIVFINNFDVQEWSINLHQLKLLIPELKWHACIDAVNPNQFSLKELYYATV